MNVALLWEGLEAELQLQDEVEDSGDQREVETNRLESFFAEQLLRSHLHD